ncbi:OmpH family outer membrane protein [Desulfovibrio ferrophilus]|uniref:Outer membrane chaperone Skp OmpH n=1 Tax=Desulfovibrio ferrophilus TaxID=241368 RepID=A0A2Z6AV45_9BACT|nr:OmpH family outer membrane protein [Desulfovibrio ferrophilus]BBD07056.1 outer membrane chaperone Skp OmpH [Desulfovibrio ferrophilus]
MRKLLFAIIAVVMLAPAAQAATKGPVAIVNVPMVIRECEQGKQVRDQLKATFKSTQTEMDRQKAELEKLRDELQKQGIVLSQEAKVDKEIEFKRKVRDYQDGLRNFQRKFKAEESKLSKPLLDVIVETLKSYGKKHGLGMILDAQAGILYADDKADITNEIIVEVNKASKAKK